MVLRAKVDYASGQTVVRLSGNIDEHSGPILADMRGLLRPGKVTFDCQHVGLINSIGVSLWLAQISALIGHELSFTHCPHTFTGLCLMIPDMIGGGQVASLYARYGCRPCKDNSQVLLIERSEVLPASVWPTKPCSRCTTPMAVEPEDQDLLDVFKGLEPDAGTD